MTKKRLIVATIFGLCCAFFCIFADQSWGLAKIGGPQLPWAVVGQILCSRTLIGVAIGISSWRIGNWAIHGGVIGIIFSLPLAFACLLTPEHGILLFWFTFLFGMIYGVFIEFMTTIVFKAPKKVCK